MVRPWQEVFERPATQKEGRCELATSKFFTRCMMTVLAVFFLAWGDNTHGQATAPAGNDFVAIDGRRFHSIAAVESPGRIIFISDRSFVRGCLR